LKNRQVYNNKEFLSPIAASSLMQVKASSRKVDCRLSNYRLSDAISYASNDPHIFNYIGKRQYELSNHLGNVLTVVSDRKYARDIDQNGEVDYFEPDILLTYDYSPFGVILKERAFEKQVCRDTLYIDNFTDINDEFSTGSVASWTRMGGTNNVVSIPVSTQYLRVAVGAANGGSVLGAQKDFALNYVGNHTISFSYNKGNLNSGNQVEVVMTDLTTNISTVLTVLGQPNGWVNYTFTYNAQSIGNYRLHFRRISATNANRNFLLDNIKITHQEIVEETICEAYGKYRYGFQGQEKDDEIKGEGNSVNYTYRMHDTRLGRFFAVDPLVHQYPYYSPFQFSGNRVIDMIELEGLEPSAYLISGNGKLTSPVISLLNAAYGLSISSLEQTTWKPYDSDKLVIEEKIQRSLTGVGDKMAATTHRKSVIHDNSSDRSQNNWFSLIVHEQIHRKQIEGIGWDIFIRSYLCQGALVPYNEIIYEYEAYKYGSNKGYDYTDDLLKYKDGCVMKILEDPHVTMEQKAMDLYIIGNLFKADVMIQEQINANQLTINAYSHVITGVYNSFLEGAISWDTYLSKTEPLVIESHTLATKNAELRKEQSNIRETYDK
jgi:RHS repeat-associated protein